MDTSGPGPQPLSKTHGHADKASEGGDDDDGPQKESHGTGTGEKYVKSSGMKADGGDFDASNPGAGKEADRKDNPHDRSLSADADSSQASSRPKAFTTKQVPQEGVEEMVSLTH